MGQDSDTDEDENENENKHAGAQHGLQGGQVQHRHEAEEPVSEGSPAQSPSSDGGGWHTPGNTWVLGEGEGPTWVLTWEAQLHDWQAAVLDVCKVLYGLRKLAAMFAELPRLVLGSFLPTPAAALHPSFSPCSLPMAASPSDSGAAASTGGSSTRESSSRGSSSKRRRGGSGGSGGRKRGSSAGGGSASRSHSLQAKLTQAGLLRHLEDVKHLAAPQAAAALGCSIASFRALCRSVGIQRWPSRRTVSALDSQG